MRFLEEFTLLDSETFYSKELDTIGNWLVFAIVLVCFFVIPTFTVMVINANKKNRRNNNKSNSKNKKVNKGNGKDKSREKR